MNAALNELCSKIPKSGFEPDESSTRKWCQNCQQITPEFMLQKPDGVYDANQFYINFNLEALEENAGLGCQVCALLCRYLIHRTRQQSTGILRSVDLGEALFQCAIYDHGLELNIQSSRPKAQEAAGTAYLDFGRSLIRLAITERADGTADGATAHGFKAPHERPVKSFAIETQTQDLMTLAQDFLRHCIESCRRGPKEENSHLLCNTRDGELNPGPPRLPTRIIDVGLSGQCPRLHVTEQGPASLQHADYVILSYCWGSGNATSCTTARNFQTRCQRIEMSEMSQTIKDAIEITRALGERFLYVDAVCIIQAGEEGDASDWQREAQFVGGYYANALCTIAAAAASDSSEGIIFPRPAELYKFPIENISVGTWTGEYSQSRQSKHSTWEATILPSNASWENMVELSPLYERGWTLQERALSRRIFYWTRDGVFFECSDSRILENGVHSPIERATIKDPFQKLGYIQNLAKEAALGKEWTDFAKHYSQLRFTFYSDALIALQGLADHIGHMFLDRYIAGIWQSQAIRGLSWQATPWEAKPARVGKYRRDAPSWSWASTNGEVQHEVYGEEMAEVLHIDDFSLQWPRDKNSEGRLVIKGHVNKFPSSSADINWESIEKFPCRFSLKFEGNSFLPFASQYGNRWLPANKDNEDRHVRFRVDVDGDDVMPANPDLISEMSYILLTLLKRDRSWQVGVDFAGIALMPTGVKENEFRRVGWMKMSWKYEKSRAEWDWWSQLPYSVIEIL